MRERERERERERQTDRQTDRQIDRERNREINKNFSLVNFSTDVTFIEEKYGKIGIADHRYQFYIDMFILTNNFFCIYMYM